MTEPVRNPYKLPETCQHAIWDKEGCYCNRVPSKTHKVCETGTCEHWVLNQYIEANSDDKDCEDCFNEEVEE